MSITHGVTLSIVTAFWPAVQIESRSFASLDAAAVALDLVSPPTTDQARPGALVAVCPLSDYLGVRTLQSADNVEALAILHDQGVAEVSRWES